MQHTNTGLTCQRIFVRECAIDVFFHKTNTFSGKCVDDKMMYGPKVLLWMRRSSQSILVRHQHQFKIKFFRDTREILQRSWVKFELGKRIYLFVLGLQYQCTIAIYK